MKEWICKEVQTDNGGYLEAETELIRCKDCKYLGNYKCYGHYCENDNYVTTGEEFCSWAERK